MKVMARQPKRSKWRNGGHRNGVISWRINGWRSKKNMAKSMKIMAISYQRPASG
jgi:hypothetical protein